MKTVRLSDFSPYNRNKGKTEIGAHDTARTGEGQGIIPGMV